MHISAWQRHSHRNATIYQVKFGPQRRKLADEEIAHLEEADQQTEV